LKKNGNKKLEAFLKERVQVAIDSLSEEIYRDIEITRVDCSNGKYDAKVYFLSTEDSKKILKKLRVASSTIKMNVLASTSWYRCPNFEFRYDEKFQKIEEVEKLFKQLEKE
jgi:ribosome-binding factor A